MSVVGLRLAVLVVDDLLEERAADPLRDGAADLAVDDRRVDHRAAVLDRDEPLDAHRARLRVDLDDRDDAAVRVGRGRIVERRGGEIRLAYRGTDVGAEVRGCRQARAGTQTDSAHPSARCPRR